ncbi:MAG TPA: nuclear transport factor 2 family protein [Hyphomicrobiaceae bacterium]|nr:nuclear transport factor 2 family protein [Hyphomicrobiaceae bacterium]
MTQNAQDRDILFKAFGRAFFKRDVEALYETVTPDFEWHTLDENGAHKIVTGKPEIGAQLVRKSDKLENIRFEDVVYHHTPEATFMTFRITATDKATGQPHSEAGIERYTFRDGKIAVKDVYRKPA